jgi:hypothetical protein
MTHLLPDSDDLTLTGYALYKTLKMGDRFIWDNREYVVTSAQSDYDYTIKINGRAYEFTCYIECVLAENGKGYMYLKNLENDPSWAIIDRIKPITLDDNIIAPVTPALCASELVENVIANSNPIDFSILGKTLAARLEPYRYMIADITNETNEDAGYWIYLKDGWIDPDFEIHMIHEYTVADVLARLPHIVRCTEHNCRYADHITITRAATCADQNDAIRHKALAEAFPQLAESAPTMPVKPTLMVPNDSSYAPSPDETLAAMGVKVMRKGKSPITTYYNGTGVTPHRIVIYRVVNAITITAMESAWGLRYGVISIDGMRRIVKSTLRDNGQWSQWEVF